MKNQLPSLFYVATLAIAAFTVSCSSNDDTPTTTDSNTEAYKVSSRQVGVTGEDNMRDLGGFVGENNKRVLYRKLYRSGELSTLTAADKDTLAKRGITQIIDLRTEAERTEKADKVLNGVTNYQLPLIADAPQVVGGPSQATVTADILAGTLDPHTIMLPLFSTIDELKEKNWEKIFDLLETGNVTLYHCTAGKDRAGMTTALVLSSLGVDKAAIIKDFMASNDYLHAANQATVDQINAAYHAQGKGEKLLPLLGVEEVYITTFFAAIDAKYGSMDNFLAKIKVDKAKMKALYLEK
jgi:protein-tyrosine phosphatase